MSHEDSNLELSDLGRQRLQEVEAQVQDAQARDVAQRGREGGEAVAREVERRQILPSLAARFEPAHGHGCEAIAGEKHFLEEERLIGVGGGEARVGEQRRG